MSIKFPETGPLGCLCITCCEERVAKAPANDDFAYRIAHTLDNFRYACEICGNKRCPHHTDHRLKCTRSNEPGQPGSRYR